jgi:P27 family predicted phage terminase small subunit
MPRDPSGPPDDLDAEAARLYRTLRKDLRDGRRWEDSDRHLLAQACRFEQQAREAREALPVENGRRVMTASGYKGQDVPHPLVKIMDGAARAYVDALRELGFTPAQRKRLDIEPVRAGGSKFGLA